MYTRSLNSLPKFGKILVTWWHRQKILRCIDLQLFIRLAFKKKRKIVRIRLTIDYLNMTTVKIEFKIPASLNL